jgi:RNA polymerase sigma factor (sigma-70 family)
MQARQDILEIFSTFLRFDNDWSGIWISEPQLRRSMQQCLAQTSLAESSEEFWALYWHKIWQTQASRLAMAHLTAYLQEACYWTARKTIANFTSGQSLADLFQMAIAKVNKVLKGFNAQQGGNLKKYASLAFSNIIKDTLRQRREVDVCTNWALLNKLSQKKLLESLQHQGLKPDLIESYVLAWKCFKVIYGPVEARSTRKMPEPDLATWEAIAKLYNTQRISQLSASHPATNPEAIKKWMAACGQSARAYLYPQLVSTDMPKPGQNRGDLLDELPDTLQESGLVALVVQEEEAKRYQERSQINEVLQEAIAKLDQLSQRLLQLYYGQALTQQQIAQQLEMKQYTVSRRLTSHRQALLSTLARWSQQTLHNSLNSDVLDQMSTLLEEWLKVHYNHPDVL